MWNVATLTLKMQYWTGVDFKEIYKKIRLLDTAAQYSAFVKFLDLARPYFVKCASQNQKKYFFRVRAHFDGNGDYFFNNISDISYRHDLFNIHKFGRCNSPFESLFYCSDSPIIAFAEVMQMTRAETRKDFFYHTTSVWSQKQPLNLTPIFEPTGIRNKNKELLSITKRCIETINTIEEKQYIKDLTRIHMIIAREFTIPFSSDNNIYLFSSAVSSYLLNPLEYKSEKLDGLIYPTCIEDCKLRAIGLNYVFNPLVVGFGNKIEFEAAYRSKMQKIGRGYYETEIKFFKKANRFTGQIVW